MNRPGPASIASLVPAAALLLAIPVLGSSSTATAAPEVRTLAWVDGTLVTTNDLDELLAKQPRPQGSAPDIPMLTPEGVLKRLIQNRLLEEEGYRIGTDEEPEVRDQVWDAKRHQGMIALLDSVSATAEPPEPEELAAIFDQSSTMWRVAHIRVGSERLARALLDSLAAGTSFGELARRHSTDTLSAKNDGDLGWAREDLYIPEFRDTLTGRPKGGVAGPVNAADGWHVLMLADIRTETIGQSKEMRRQLEEAARREAGMAKVNDYVASLREKYGVVVEDAVLASLDYASADKKVQEALRTDERVVARLPWKTITVRDLTRRIRFKHFHGLEGKAEAPQLRDKLVDDWITELLLRHEAATLGFDQKPGIVAWANSLERDLIRESVIKMFVNVPFDPEPKELERYWSEHPEEFTPAPRIQVDGVLVADEASARRFRQQLEAGAQLRWLADRTAEVQDAKPAMFAGWVDPASLGLKASELEKGHLIGPLAADGAWAVGSVVDVEHPGPLPFAECREHVLAAMKRKRQHEAMTKAIAKLEAAAKIEVVDGAREIIAARIEKWLAPPPDAAAGSAPGRGAQGEGSR